MRLNTYLLLILLLVIPYKACAQEVISSYDANTISTLNEELRKNRIGYSSVRDRFDALLPIDLSDDEEVTGVLSVANGGTGTTSIDGFQIGVIKDYGTSSSTGTTKDQSDLKVCYGSVSVASNSSTSVTNLPFSSSSSYTVTITLKSSSYILVAYWAKVTNNSGSQFTIAEQASQGNQVYNWIAIGT